MRAFELAVATSIPQAIGFLAEGTEGALPLAGGTDLLGMMKEHLEEPGRLVSLASVGGLEGIEALEDGSVRIGAMTRLERVRREERIASGYPALAEAIGRIATPQIRAMATLGGNLCQRPRCWYLRGKSFDCRRKGGARCFSIRGDNRYHAILGGSGCFIVHPSDAAPALVVLGATVSLAGPGGERDLPLEEFFVGPAEEMLRETVLRENEILTAVTLPASTGGPRSAFEKITQRGAWDFALASAAVRLDLEAGRCREARVCLGGVAPVPWRAKAAEEELAGKRIDEKRAERAAEAALEGSRPMSGNAYKVRLARIAVRRAILRAAAA